MTIGQAPSDDFDMTPVARRQGRPAMIDAMTTRRGLVVAPFDPLADPGVIGDLAATAEAAG